MKRIAKKKEYTIGKMYIDDKYFCDTIEPPYMGTKKEDPVEKIRKTKAGNTAIPEGIYRIDMNTVSLSFKDRSWARPYGGKIPRLLNVTGFEGVLIHVGNVARRYGGDSKGCILVGNNNVVGKVTNSTVTFHKLMNILKD